MASLTKTFRGHLEALLPLPNPSGDPKANMALRYCRKTLRAVGRPFTEDRDHNLWAGPAGGNTPGRAMVAHTDSVGHCKMPGHQSVNLWAGVYSGAGYRPIGGDDKVGIAIALTIAGNDPTIGILLTSDEEIGGLGAASVRIPHQYLMVECDRRGAVDMVTEIGGEIMGPDAERAACRLLPHREPCMGAFTDVDTLMARGLADHAVNLSCGYYHPHTKREIVVFTHALQTLHDAMALLTYLPPALPPAEYDRGWYVPTPRKQGRPTAKTAPPTAPPDRGFGWGIEECDLCGRRPEGIEADSWADMGHGFGMCPDCVDCYREWEQQGDMPETINATILRDYGLIGSP